VLSIEKREEQTRESIPGGGKAHEGEHRLKTATVKGPNPDFKGEKMSFHNIQNVVPELSFVRSVRFFFSDTSLYVTFQSTDKHGVNMTKIYGLEAYDLHHTRENPRARLNPAFSASNQVTNHNSLILPLIAARSGPHYYNKITSTLTVKAPVSARLSQSLERRPSFPAAADHRKNFPLPLRLPVYPPILRLLASLPER